MAVYQDKNGQWWAAVEIGYTRTGGRRRARRKATGQRDAEARERKLLRERDAGKLTAARTPTVKTWAEKWIAEQADRVRPTTWTGYRSMTADAIESIGKTKLDVLSPNDIRTFTAHVAARGVTTTAVRDAQSRLYKMLRDARAEGWSVPDTALAVRLPARASTDRDAIPPDQAHRILAAASDVVGGSRWVAALLQGMRQGECLGLTWDAVDLDRGTVDVSWQLQAIPYRHGCDPKCGRRFGGDCPGRELQTPAGYQYRPLAGQLALTRPKTSRGQRIIPLVPWMVAALRQWREQAPRSEHNLVWPDDHGQPRTKQADSAAWRALQAAAGVAHPSGRPWVLHEARHTTASLLLDGGVDPHTVTAIMGHSSIVTSRGYQHVSQALARQAMDAVAERLGLTT